MARTSEKLRCAHQDVLEEVRTQERRAGTPGLESVDPARAAVRLPLDLWRESDHPQNGRAREGRSRAFSQLAEQYDGARRGVARAQVQMSSVRHPGASCVASWGDAHVSPLSAPRENGSLSI